MLDFSSVIEQTPADIWQATMMAERRQYYGAPGRYEEELQKDIDFPLFAEGRPGILASEMRFISKEVAPLV